MRKKSSYSEENFLSAHSAKVSEYFRQNPRPPRRMKSVKTKYPNPTIRTVGQLSCGGKNAFPASPFGYQNMSEAEPARRMSDPSDPWSKLHRTFSNSQNSSPRNFHHGDEYPPNEPAFFCSVTDMKEENVTEREAPAPVTRKTSESAVQVNMFHCKDCRRHIKIFKSETSCTESDSESNRFASEGCVTCERQQGKMNQGDGDKRVEDEKKNEKEGSLDRHQETSKLDSTQRDCSTPREHDSSLSALDKKPKFDEKQNWLQNIKLMTLAMIVIPLILHLLQTQSFSALLSVFNFLVRSFKAQEETEETTIVGWVLDLFFGVQGLAKPLPLFLYLF